MTDTSLQKNLEVGSIMTSNELIDDKEFLENISENALYFILTSVGLTSDVSKAWIANTKMYDIDDKSIDEYLDERIYEHKLREYGKRSHTGYIKKKLPNGFGFIVPSDGGDNVYFHHKDVVSKGGFRALKQNYSVGYDVSKTKDGKRTKAVNVYSMNIKLPSKPNKSISNPVVKYQGFVRRKTLKGFGFITPSSGFRNGGDDIFFHQSEETSSGGFKALAKRDFVEFGVVTTKNGKRKAVNVKVLHLRQTYTKVIDSGNVFYYDEEISTFCPSDQE